MPTPDPVHDPRIEALPAAEIRRRFVDFFAARDHTIVDDDVNRLADAPFQLDDAAGGQLNHVLQSHPGAAERYAYGQFDVE